MSIVFNIAKGRVIEFFERVKNNDPSASALVLIPLETTGLETDSVLQDKDTVAAVLSGTTNEQTTMGRKTLTDSDLAAMSSTPDDTNDRNERSIPDVTWSAPTGNPVSKILIAYVPNTGTSTDSDMIPLTLFDRALTPDGNDFKLNGGAFIRAS